jgi:hypothetical protein
LQEKEVVDAGVQLKCSHYIYLKMMSRICKERLESVLFFVPYLENKDNMVDWNSRIGWKFGESFILDLNVLFYYGVTNPFCIDV